MNEHLLDLEYGFLKEGEKLILAQKLHRSDGSVIENARRYVRKENGKIFEGVVEI